MAVRVLYEASGESYGLDQTSTYMVILLVLVSMSKQEMCIIDLFGNDMQHINSRSNTVNSHRAKLDTSSLKHQDGDL